MVQGFVIAMAAFVIAALTIFLVFRYFSMTRYPLDSEQVVQGSDKEVAFQLAKLIDYCWEENNYGAGNLEQDCFLVTINSEKNLSATSIKSQISYPQIKIKSLNFTGGESVKAKIIYHPENGTIEIKGFMELLNGICQPQYGEDCYFPDCNCTELGISDICLPSYTPNKITAVGCVKPDYVHILNRGSQCKYNWECEEDLTCGQTVRFDDFEFACCPNGTGWNGNECIKLKEIGEECEETEECEINLNCNNVSLNFTEYSKVCCVGQKHWNGSACVYVYGEICFENQECDLGLKCNSNPEKTGKNCCPPGEKWNGSACELKEVDVLVVALKTNMKKVYSDADIENLENKVDEYISTISTTDDLVGLFVYLDEDLVKNIIGSKVTNPGDWNNIDGILDQLIPKLKAKYLIILGGYNRFVQAPIGSSQGSDDPYGDTDRDGSYLPDVSVGRIPDPNNGDLQVLLNGLNTAISVHKDGGLTLDSHVAPIMGCGGYDNRNWNSGKCFCQAIWPSTCVACGSCCGCINSASMSGKGFVMILSHGPGPSSTELYKGGCLDVRPNFITSLNVDTAFWISMSCGGGHLKLKSQTSGSMAMTFLKKGGAIYVGSTDLNYGGLGGCSVPGGDSCIGSLYVEFIKRLQVGKSVGAAYREGKNYYYGRYNCGAGKSYQTHINCLYGDPTLKIKSMW